MTDKTKEEVFKIVDDWFRDYVYKPRMDDLELTLQQLLYLKSKEVDHE